MNFLYEYRLPLSVIFILLLTINIFPALVQVASAVASGDWQNYIPESPLWAAVMLLALYAVKSVLFFVPIYLLYFSAGMLFTTPWALLVTYLGLFCEITIGYYIGHYMGRSRVSALLQKKPQAARFLERLNSDSGIACLVSRAVPMPPEIISFFYGASAMPLKRYLIFSLIGLTPAMLPCVLAGTAFTSPLDKGFIIPLGISLLFSLIAYSGQQLWEKYGK